MPGLAKQGLFVPLLGSYTGEESAVEDAPELNKRYWQQ